MDTNWYKKRLKELGKTQAHIAEAIGRDRTVVTKILQGSQTLRLDQVHPIAQVLDVSPAELLAHSGFPELEKTHPQFDQGRMHDSIVGVLQHFSEKGRMPAADDIADAIMGAYEYLKEAPADEFDERVKAEAQRWHVVLDKVRNKKS